MDTVEGWLNIDGQYVRRPLSIEDILAHAGKAKAREDPLDETAVPQVGILSKTEVGDPVARWVFPIRLRRESDQDIVFIGEYALWISRLQPDGSLFELYREEDFDSRIRNTVMIDFVEAAMPPDETHCDRDSPDLPAHSDEMATDHSSSASRDKEAGSRQRQEARSSSSKLPPQSIALVLESGDLLFLSLIERLHLLIGTQVGSRGVESSVNRLQTTLPMLFEQPGKHLTVDPFARYLAAGSSERYFSVFKLDADTILCRHADVSSRPVTAIRHFQVDGIILKMEFLYPQLNDHALLMVLVVFRGRTRLKLFQWKSVEEVMYNGHFLDEELPYQCSIPQLVVPLKFRSSFLLACSDAVYVCDGVSDGHPEYIQLPLLVEPPQESHKNRGDTPLWTAYTKPMRFSPFADVHDDLYLAREDGVVKFIEIENTTELLQAEMLAGVFACKIGSAFASLSRADTSSNDMLIACSDSAAGVIYEIFPGPVSKPQLVTTIPCCTQLIDVAVHTGGDRLNQQGRYERATEAFKARQRDQIYACIQSGREEAVAQIRAGYQASLISTVPISTNSICCLPFVPFNAAAPALLLTQGNQSALLAPADDEGNDLKWIEASHTWLDLATRTVLCLSQGNLTIQVTEKDIRASAEQTFYHTPRILQLQTPLNNLETVSAADVCDGYIFVALTSASRCILRVYSSVNHAILETASNTQHHYRQITKLVAFNYDGQYRCFVGYSDSIDGEQEPPLSLLRLFAVDFASTKLVALPDISMQYGSPRSSAEACATLRLAEPFLESGDACTGLVRLQCGSGTGAKTMLLIGLKSGELWAMMVERDKYFLVFRESIGIMPVTLSHDTAKPSVAIILCDGIPYKAILDTSNGFRTSLRPIWITSPHDETFQQIQDIHHVCCSAGNLFIAASGEILVTTSEDVMKPLPRAVDLKSIPQQCERLDGKVGAFFTVLGPGREYELEEVTCLSQWRWSEDLQETHSDGVRDRQAPYTVVGFRNGVLRVQEQDRTLTSIELPSPVHCMCYTESMFFVAAEEKIYWLHLNTYKNPGKLEVKVVGEYDLPSPAVSVSYEAAGAGKAFLYVNTAQHSMIVLMLLANNRRPSMDPIAMDEIAREGLSHVSFSPNMSPVSGHGAVVLSDNTCSLTGLIHKVYEEVPRGAPDFTTIFEAELRWPVSRLVHSEARQPWDRFWKRQKMQGVLPWTTTLSDLLGISINGTITSFTLLDEDLLKRLAFIQNAAQRSAKICPITHSVQRRRFDHCHIDGDLLRRCLYKLDFLEDSEELRALYCEIEEDVDHITLLELINNSLERLLVPVI